MTKSSVRNAAAIVLSTAFLLSATIARGEDAPSPGAEPEKAPATINVTIKPSELLTGEGKYDFPSDKIDELRDDYVKAAGVRLGYNDDGSWIGFATEEVKGVPGRAWGLQLLNAFARAEDQVRASFIMSQGARVAAKRDTELLNDPGVTLSAPEPIEDTDKLKRIHQKVLSVQEASLDVALRKLGVSETDIAAMNAPKKRIAYEAKLGEQVISTACGQIGGLRVIQTFEGHVGDAYSVGVMMRFSEKNKVLGQLIRNGGGQLVDDGQGQGKPLDQWLPSDGRLLLKDWGVRVFRDEKGQPIVAAFSQAPVIDPPPGASMQWKQEQLNVAYIDAENYARGMMITFAAGATSVETNSQNVEQIQRGMISDMKGPEQVFEDPPRLQHALSQAIHTSANEYFRGGVVARKWKAVHPETKSTFVGVVYVWTPASAEQADRVRSGKPAVAPPENKTTGGHRGNDYPVKDF